MDGERPAVTVEVPPDSTARAEQLLTAILELGRADETSLPRSLEQLADSLRYQHAAIVEAERRGPEWVPRRTICRSREFSRACRSVLKAVCESAHPVSTYTTNEGVDLTESEAETGTFAAVGVQLSSFCSEARKTVLLLTSGDRCTTLTPKEEQLLGTVGILVCKALSRQQPDGFVPDKTGQGLIGDTIGIMSHDILNPVGTIIGYADLLLQGRLGEPMQPDQRLAVDKIRENSLFIRRLLGELLNSVEIESGHVRLDLQPRELEDVIEASFGRCRLAAERKLIPLQLALESPGLRAWVDMVRVGQIMDNLISNAIKFSHRGKRVVVGARASGPWVEVRVEDQGLGIPEGEVGRLFRKFSRTTTRGTAGEKSTGLGLYIVHELVTLHGGSVRVETELDRGSTFIFTLPRVDSPIPD